MEDVIAFFNSNFFIALVTIITGSVAILLYFQQKKDRKKDSAKTLYYEITNSERIIKDLKTLKKQNGNLLSLWTTAGQYTIGDSGWEENKYLFINDFDENEWENLNTFLNQINEYRRVISQIADLFPKNMGYRMQAIHTELSKIASEQAKELSELEVPEDPNDEEYKAKTLKIIKQYEDRAQGFITIFINTKSSSKYSYMPEGTFAPLEKLLEEINTELSISSVGTKLKKLGE